MRKTKSSNIFYKRCESHEEFFFFLNLSSDQGFENQNLLHLNFEEIDSHIFFSFHFNRSIVADLDENWNSRWFDWR